MKNTWLALTGAASLLAAVTASAVPISGSISFNGTAVFNSTPISGATKFNALNNAYVAPFQQQGDYSVVANFQAVTFTPFTFSPPAASILPLWTFTVGATVYSFDATSVSSSFDAVHNTWNIGGNGIAKITGKDDTTGTWNLSAGAAGASFFFGSAATVPDGGTTVMLLGAALSGLGLIRRKLIA